MPTKTDAILIGVGVLGAVLIAAYSPGIVRASSLSTLYSGSITNLSQPIRLENIPGIDLSSLYTVRQKGLY